MGDQLVQKCGSCWAHSAVGTLESVYAIATGKLEKLSEQQLVDCASSSGCLGGYPNNGFQYYETHGVCTESSYEYVCQRGRVQGINLYNGHLKWHCHRLPIREYV